MAADSPDQLGRELRGPHRQAQRVLAVVMARTDRDQILAKALAEGTGFPLVCETISALGDASGGEGTAALKQVFRATGRGTASPRGLAALAIAKRAGAEESEWLAAAFDDAHPEVRGYVLTSLAGAADDSAWDKVFAVLPRFAARSSSAVPADFTVAISYLGRHVKNPERRERVVHQIRRSWPKLDPSVHDWVRQHWPDAAPEGPEPTAVSAPDADALRAWAREPLFRVLWTAPAASNQAPGNDAGP